MGVAAWAASRPWLGKELCFAKPSRTCLQPMPGALIDTV
jgi:hypothetical protein